MRPSCALILLGLTAAAPVGMPPPVAHGASRVSEDLVQQTIDELIRRCPLLIEWRPHVASISYSTSDSGAWNDYHAREYGWQTTLEIGFLLREDTPTPPGMENAGSVNGDVMLFDFGGGRRPGFIVNKPTSRFACRLPVDSTDDVYIADPWMKRLDAPPARRR